MAGTPRSNCWASQFTPLVLRLPRTTWSWRWESTSSYCSENGWRGTVDVLPETLQHSFSWQRVPTKTPEPHKGHRPRHSGPEASQGGVCEAQSAVADTSITDPAIQTDKSDGARRSSEVV